MSYCVTDLDMEEELADYNGDDENEGEFEADKQAELAQKWGCAHDLHQHRNK